MTQGKNQVNPELVEGLTLSKVEGSKLLSIHEFAQVCRTTPRTLRFYEQKGLFKPTKVDAWNKYRFYDLKQARDFLKIRLLQNFHIPLGQIKKSSLNNAEGYLQNRLNAIKEEIKEKQKEYNFLEKINDFLFRDDFKTTLSSSRKRGSGFPIRSGMTNGDFFQTITFGPYNLFCMKVEYGEYARITEYIKTLWLEAKRLKLECKNSEITFYLDNRYNPKNTPLEVALICKGEMLKQVQHDKEKFYFKTYAKTNALVYKYIGPYEYLILVYQRLFSYIESQKINLKGLVFETYKYGPLNTKSKYDYQTTIGFPV